MKVSVLMPTYNHEKYIAQAIESVMAQQVDFEIELLINDDCSTDGTSKIAEEFAKKYPEKIKFFHQKKNLGLMKNYRFLLEKASGKYIAILESDDYWTDVLKLKKQVDFLESNQDYSLVCTSYDRVDEKGNLLGNVTNEYFEKLEGFWYEDLLCRCYIGALTVMFSRESFDRFCNIEEYVDLNFKTFDYPTWLLISANSKCKYLSDNTSAYRNITTSISHSGSYEKRVNFEKSVCAIQDYCIEKNAVSDCFDYFRFQECRNRKFLELALSFGKLSDFVKYARRLKSRERRYKIIHLFPVLYYFQHKIRFH